MEHKTIAELTAENQILLATISQIESDIAALTATENQKLAELFQALTGIPDVTVKVNTDKTEINVPCLSKKWGNDISIYHYKGWTDNIRNFELSWFSSTATIATDAANNNYLKYLTALGRIAESLNTNDVIQTSIVQSINTIEAIEAKHRKVSNEFYRNESQIHSIQQANEREELLNLINGPVTQLSVVTNHDYANMNLFGTEKSSPSSQIWDVSARRGVVFDALTIIKNKTRYQVIFHEFNWVWDDTLETPTFIKNHIKLDYCKSKKMSESDVLSLLKKYKNFITKLEMTAAV